MLFQLTIQNWESRTQTAAGSFWTLFWSDHVIQQMKFNLCWGLRVPDGRGVALHSFKFLVNNFSLQAKQNSRLRVIQLHLNLITFI